MKKTISFVAAIAVLLVMTGSLAAANPKPAPQIAGGYAEVEVTNEEARANAEWAVREQMNKSGGSIELLTLRKAELQVVAGLNYRFCMQVTVEGKNGADATTYFVTAVVYVDLKQKKQLTRWEKSDCNAASEPKGSCG